MEEEVSKQADVFDFDAALDRFEGVWQRGSPPEIAEFLPAATGQAAGDAGRRYLLGELVMIDLWYRWRQAACGGPCRPGQASADGPQSDPSSESTSTFLPERPCLEDYLRQYPELGPSNRLPVEMIGEEYRVRRCCGDRPGHEVYLARFPEQAARLKQNLSLIDRELPSDTVINGPATASRPAAATVLGSADGDRAPLPERIGKYQIVSSLGKGGQAEVYRAVHPTLAKELVIKIGRTAAAGSPDALDRLVAEGRVLAELEHPNLARVYDLDFDGDRPFLVMEYIRGCNLRQQARQGRLGSREAAALVAKVARALAVAHARGIVHQDIKPGNIILDEAGQPRVIDFGLARLRHAWADEPAEPGSISGTAQYMAPEQARGETDRVDPRSDIFAVGAVLYYLLVGEAPFGGSNAHESLDRACRCEFDASALSRAEVPRRLEKICLHAMQADPADRYAGAADLAADLERFVARPQRLKKALAGLAGGLLLVLLAVGVWSVVGGNRGLAPPQIPPTVTPRPLPEHLKGRAPLRHDFPVKFELVGQRVDPAGEVYLTEGQRVAFRVEVERDCYVGIWHIDHRGNITQLFPRKRGHDHFVRAGEPRTIPGEMEYAIEATVSEGPEYVHLAASAERWELNAGRQAGPYVVFATPEERAQWEEQMRGLVIRDDPSSAVSEEVVYFQVLPRKE